MGILIFILGLCCGSFVNMLVFRTARRYKLEGRGKSKQKKRSFCDFCGRQLEWHENIPVLSWVMQSGKSKCCGKKLPVLYPIVEITMGLLFLLNYNNQIPSIPNNFQLPIINYQMVLGFVVVTMLVFAAVFDIKYMILPDFSTGILIVVAVTRVVMLGLGGNYGEVVSRIISAGGGAGFLLMLYWLTKGKGMGMGDVKLAVFMGLWLGWPKIVVAFYVAFVVGAVVGGGIDVGKKAKKKVSDCFRAVFDFGNFSGLVVGRRSDMKKGVTLIEVLLVMSILLLMVGIMTGSLNPIALINKGKDARRKKDINRIKIAMEAYMTDEGCFPSDLTELTSEANCGTDVFSPWLNIWPCDPNGQPYHLFVEDVECPSWFKVIVYLENEKDRDIPDWWYDNPPDSYFVGDGSLSNADVNFGTSSTNVLWYERIFASYCFNTGQCQIRPGGEGTCQPADPSTSCAGDNCYLDGSCLDECQVSCCLDGQSCD